MSKVCITQGGLSEAQSKKAWSYLRKAWDIQRSLQFNKTASILRMVITQAGRPDAGILPTSTPAPGLSDLPVLWMRVSSREVQASNGKLQLTDSKFVFWDVEVLMTDNILYLGKTYRVVDQPFWDPDIGRCDVVGRAL